MTLFPDFEPKTPQDAPLPERLRPSSLDDIVGLHDLLDQGRFLRNAIESDRIPSMIFWGPPGSGKTTLARIIAKSTRARFVQFSATSTGIKDIKALMEEARKARGSLMYDKGGEEHYNIISARHKSLRNGDADASVYWLVRMLEGGEDPMYIARRLVRAASEDIGNADPQALVFAIAVQQTVHFLGMPEAGVALAQLVTYLAAAPKSNAAYIGYGEAVREVRQGDNPGVPLHIRNAPTRLMKDLGYGRGYQYAHDFDEQTVAMNCLPEALADRRFYEPKDAGAEAKMKTRLDAMRDARKKES